MDAHALFSLIFSSSRKTKIIGIILCSIVTIALVMVIVMAPTNENKAIAEVFFLLNASVIFLNVRILFRTRKLTKGR